ncbi:MAG TPA: GAF domain-containing sensor histidine kinase [Phenylobacterium sp.]|uniref:GAF domain-containing sensor histidine kinase n=1 Tax=Phenylobacterium sp. TaxID=1871053 RepID=UPI002D452BF5|nr:GAF domain-containing sensor histidine kinase [Phenylobacterium sp.]HZZ68415.1 GAF domain-containing sensor histidine kinase [Phenylobacterium sp.]
MSIAEDVEKIARIEAVPMILEVVCRTTGMGFAAVARVTEDRWIACAVRDEIAFGLVPGGELEVGTTICDEIRQSGQAVVIDHVAEDAEFRGHPTPAQYGFQSYISQPIFRDGQFFGTLCAIDPRPAQLKNPAVMGMFKLFAELIAQHMESQDRLAESQAQLLSERHAAELREQFIAVLGHDLRNPLASIQAGGRLLAKTALDSRARMLVSAMQASVMRMAGLIDDVMDFARARLGGGFEIERRTDANLREAILLAVEELRLANPDREIVAEIALDAAVACDSGRVAQLLSNLLANALRHGEDSGAVSVRAATAEGRFALSVANAGPPIPPDRQAVLFQPFERAEHHHGQQGLGLGLYIAAEIARAHGGTLNVVSDPAETRFTFSMPLAAH